MICTFYSFKGGVGRSMALANVAELLYRQGLHILMIDFDLEAPGLERFFEVQNAMHSPDEVMNARGMIDLLLSYKELRSLPQLDLKETAESQTQNELPFHVEPLSNFIMPIYEEISSGGSLAIIPAGRRGDANFTRYAKQVRSFDWNDFYTNWNGEQFFEWFRREAEAKFDIILVDSRTGVTEMSGVCNYQLADVVILFVASNQQNIDGIERIAQSLTDPKLVEEGRNGRPLSLVFVPSRIEHGEKTLLDNFEKQFNRILERFPTPQLTFEKSAFIDLKIPYVPYFAYTEDVAAREADRASASDLVTAFRNLALALAQLVPNNHRLKPLLSAQKNTNRHLEQTRTTVVQKKVQRKGNEPYPTPTLLSAWPTLALVALGLPTIAIVIFFHNIAQYPWLAITLTLAYELLVFIGSILARVWQKLENQWIEQIVEWMNNQIRNTSRTYRTSLRYAYQDFDVRGLSTQGTFTLNLEQVFVELRASPVPVHQLSSDPLQAPKALSIGRHSVWDYLVPRSLMSQHLVIIGPPGSGKTTLLKHLALTLISRKRFPEQSNIPYTLPILLFLRDYANDLKDNSSFSLVNAVQAQLDRWGQRTSQDWIEHQLARGHCLILLDGLDEVGDPNVRKQTVEWIQRQMVAYGKNRFIITSLPFGYRSNPLSGVTVLEVLPFSSQQIERFVHNWYLANEIMRSQRNDSSIRLRAKESANDLIHRLDSLPALSALAVNPLLLTMIATIHYYRSSLPGGRVGLYSEICEVFLGKRQEARGLMLMLNAVQKQLVLQPLAYNMMLLGVRDIYLDQACTIISQPLSSVSSQIPPKEFLQDVENTSGLFLEKESNIYSFAHLSFQEYLAAVHVKDAKLVYDLALKVNETWWHETIRLYCAQADATPIIAACLASNHLSISALTLALECQQEALQVQPSVLADLDVLLNNSIENTNSEMRRIAAEALLTKRLRHIVYFSNETYIDTSLITNVEYQLFLDDQQTQGVHYLLDNQDADHFPKSQRRNPVLNVQPSDADAFCDWLTERERNTWQYRRLKTEELENIDIITPEIRRLLAEGGILIAKEHRRENG